MSKTSPIWEIPSLAERGLETGTDGCIVPLSCPVAVCPSCKSNEECQMNVGSCHSCSVYVCAKKTESGHQSNTGGIVGGAVGGVAALALIVAFALYWFVYRKRRSLELDDLDLMMNDMKWDEESGTTTMGRDNSSDSAVDGSGPAGSANTTRPLAKPPMRRHQTYYTNRAPVANRRLSSYESFTKPLAKRRGSGRPQLLRQAGTGGNQRLVYMHPSHRNSVATTVSTTNASNILPIAYIPGVTVRPNKNNTRSIYSYEEESIFSDWNTIENASIVDKRADERGDRGTGANGRDPTMTAIKAQPRLVPVDRIEEEDEDEDTDEDTEEPLYNAAQYLPVQRASLQNVSQPTQVDHEDAYSSDSDVDSDIGEINRAASMRRAQPREVLMDGHSSEIPIDVSDIERPMRIPSANGLGAGSFLLDVEMDLNR